MRDIKNISKEIKKVLVATTTALMLTVNGKTSTKEVKDALHTLFPGIGLNQKEVSESMDEFYKMSTNIIKRKFNGIHFIYEDIETEIDSENNSDLTEDEKENDVFIETQVVNINNPILGDIKKFSTDFLESLDKNLLVAYSKDEEDYILTGTGERVEARKLFKTVSKSNTKHNDIRSMRLKSYLKQHSTL